MIYLDGLIYYELAVLNIDVDVLIDVYLFCLSV